MRDLNAVTNRSRLALTAIRHPAARSCRGSATVWVVILSMSLIMVAALVLDGGRLLSARREALDVASNAALAGAQALDESDARTGSVEIEVRAVQAAAQSYLNQAGYSGTVAVVDGEVVVTTTEQVSMQMLAILGIPSQTVTGKGTARLVRGVDGPDT